MIESVSKYCVNCGQHCKIVQLFQLILIFRCICECVYYWPWAALLLARDFNSKGDLEDQGVHQAEDQGVQEGHHAGLLGRQRCNAGDQEGVRLLQYQGFQMVLLVDRVQASDRGRGRGGTRSSLTQLR